MKKRVMITRHHINRGKPEDGNSCPIALALQSRRDVSYVEVGGGVAEIWGKTKRGATPVRTFKLPLSARNFIDRFDMGRPVEPFSFTLGALIEERVEE